MAISVEEFTRKIQSSDRREQLEAERDWIINELNVHRCQTCTGSRLRTGDQAALLLRLDSVLEKLAAIPDPSAEQSPLAAIRSRRDNVIQMRPESAS